MHNSWHVLNFSWTQLHHFTMLLGILSVLVYTARLQLTSHKLNCVKCEDTSDKNVIFPTQFSPFSMDSSDIAKWCSMFDTELNMFQPTWHGVG